MKITFDSNELQGICFPEYPDIVASGYLEAHGPNVPCGGVVVLTGEWTAIKQMIDIIDSFLLRAGSGAEALEIEILPDRVNIRGWCDDALAADEAVKNEY